MIVDSSWRRNGGWWLWRNCQHRHIFCGHRSHEGEICGLPRNEVYPDGFIFTLLVELASLCLCPICLCLILNHFKDFEMDVRDMTTFESGSFDTVIDKGISVYQKKNLLNYAYWCNTILDNICAYLLIFFTFFKRLYNHIPFRYIRKSCPPFFPHWIGEG